MKFPSKKRKERSLEKAMVRRVYHNWFKTERSGGMHSRQEIPEERQNRMGFGSWGGNKSTNDATGGKKGGRRWVPYPVYQKWRKSHK